MGQKTLALMHDRQQSAFETAKEAVAADVEGGLLDADEWNGEVTDGEAIRLLAQAYTGDISFDTPDSTR